ncbi:hypothetical protein DID78_04660 [Candidatus Marinamargulisbacteria bacterium SCGC AG-343-D04]|nr:hypothetical protein DID78_04660 [Candidatus Marinamargulisbacteria bacterium SCGC AG-343-D04]
MNLRLLLSSALFLLTLSTYSISSVMRLNCDTLYYDEYINKVYAKGNVNLELNEATISASQLTFYVDDNIVISTGNVTIKRGKEYFNSSSLLLDLTDNALSLTDIHISVTPPKTNGKVYINIKELIDKPHVKIGKHSVITTCDHPNPHHSLHSWRLHYYPDTSLHLFLSYFKNDLSFFPFTIIPFSIPLLEVLPVPYYYYKLGKQKMVLNFPTIGKKSNNPDWGWFVQNSFDYRYKNNKTSTLYVDWYEANQNRRGEWGYGAHHFYGNDNIYGDIYAYNYDFILNDVKQNNTVYSINQTVTIKDYEFFGSYKRKDVDERINSSGSDERIDKSFRLSHLIPDTPLTFEVKENQQLKYQNKTLSSSLNKSFLHQNFIFDIKRKEFFSTHRDNVESSLVHNKEFKHGFHLKQTVNFNQYDTINDQTPLEQTLKYASSITKLLPYDINMNINISYLHDLDNERVTADSLSAINNYLYKLPEIEFKKTNATFLTLNSSSVVRVGSYREVRYNATNKTHSYPIQEHKFEPNIYYLSQHFSKTVKELPFLSTYTFSTRYEQYLFKNKNLSPFEGDAQYSFGLNSSLESTYFKFIKLKSSYTSNYAPKENNSPFYAYKKSFRESNALSETLTFFYKKNKSPTFNHSIDFSWSHSTGYNWLRDSQPYNDYKSNLVLKVDQHKLSVAMGQKLNFSRASRKSKYDPLNVSLSLNTRKKVMLNYAISYNLNDIVYEDKWNVLSSSATFKIPIGKDPLFAWHINAYYRYKPTLIGEEFQWDSYELSSISITKKEHKREFELGYKKLNNEFFFKYIFTLFPDDPIVLRRKNDIVSFEGRLSKQSEERFK